MSHPIEVIEATRRFLMEGLNGFIGDIRTMLDDSRKIIYLSMGQDSACGEKAWLLRAGFTEDETVCNIGAGYETTDAEWEEFCKIAAGIFAEAGKIVYLEGDKIESSVVIQQLASASQAYFFSVKEATQHRLCFSEEPVVAGQPGGTTVLTLSDTSDNGVQVLESLLAVLSTAFRMTVETSDGTKMNHYGVISLFRELEESQKPAEPAEAKPA